MHRQWTKHTVVIFTCILQFRTGKVIFVAQAYENSEIAQSRDYLFSMNV